MPQISIRFLLSVLKSNFEYFKICWYFVSNVSLAIAAQVPSSHAKSTLDESINNRKDCVTDDEENTIKDVAKSNI